MGREPVPAGTWSPPDHFRRLGSSVGCFRMSLRRPLLVFIAIAALLLVLRTGPARSADAPPAPAPPPASPALANGAHADGHGGESTYQKEILPFLTKHCFACHGNGKAKG